MIPSLSLKHKLILYLILTKGDPRRFGSLVAAELAPVQRSILLLSEYAQALYSSRRLCSRSIMRMSKLAQIIYRSFPELSCFWSTHPDTIHDDIDGEYVHIDYANNSNTITCLE